MRNRNNSIKTQLDLKKIMKKYKELYKKELIEDIKSETSGYFQKILEGIFKCQRND